MDFHTKETGTLNPIERLLVLQDRDRRLRQLTREVEDIPARKKLIESRLKEHREALHREQEEHKKKLSAAKQVDIDIESLKTRILKLREQQGQVKTNEQYRAIEHEVGSVQQQIKDLEDQEIVFMEEAETIKNRVTESEKALRQEDTIVKSDWAAQDDRVKDMQAEIEALKQERSALAAELDPDWLARYERVFKHTGDFGLVPVDSGSCGGCHMKLPPQLVQDAKRGTAMTSCGYCGRILYWRP
jgi:uncharacterized protein